MGNNRGTYGPALMARIDAELAKQPLTATAWCRMHGFEVANLGKWRAGTLPGLDHIVALAEALGLPPLELLAETIGATDDPPTIADALRRDPGLSEAERAMLGDVWQGLQKWRSGAPEVKTTNKRHR